MITFYDLASIEDPIERNKERQRLRYSMNVSPIIKSRGSFSFKWGKYAEEFVQHSYYKRGFTYYNSGWPDLFVHNEKTNEWNFVEIKSGFSQLRQNQRDMHKVLHKVFGKEIIVIKPSEEEIMEFAISRQ